jgi:TPP-dependent pyruvate/acetoin dehydrogenase alpha subunit
MTGEEIAAERARIEAVVEDAAAFAEQSPEVPVQELARDVYANPWSDDPRGSAIMPPGPAAPAGGGA